MRSHGLSSCAAAFLAALISAACTSAGQTSADVDGGRDAAPPLDSSTAIPDTGSAPDSGAPMDAQGADAQGSDAAPCIAPPNCTGTCMDNRCLTVLASDPNWATAIAIDDENVYWVSELGGTVSAVPKAGGPSRILAHTSSPIDVAAGGGYVYWTGLDGVHRVSRNGGKSEFISPPTGAPSRVAVDSARVYWTTAATGGVYAAPLDGGVVATLASNESEAQNLVVGAHAVYWLNYTNL